jgi:hypothetical protein
MQWMIPLICLYIVLSVPAVAGGSADQAEPGADADFVFRQRPELLPEPLLLLDRRYPRHQSQPPCPNASCMIPS